MSTEEYILRWRTKYIERRTERPITTVRKQIQMCDRHDHNENQTDSDLRTRGADRGISEEHDSLLEQIPDRNTYTGDGTQTSDLSFIFMIKYK